MPTTKNHGEYLKYKKIISHECWRTFQKKYPNCKELGLDYWTIRKILSDFSDLVMEEVFNHPLGFDLPFNFGTLRMIGNPVKKRTFRYKVIKIDYVRTDNVIYGLYWIFKKSKKKNVKFYNFKTAKLVTKEIIKRIKEDKFLNWIVVPDKSKALQLDV